MSILLSSYLTYVSATPLPSSIFRICSHQRDPYSVFHIISACLGKNKSNNFAFIVSINGWMGEFLATNQTITRSKSAIETVEIFVKYVQN